MIFKIKISCFHNDILHYLLFYKQLTECLCFHHKLIPNTRRQMPPLCHLCHLWCMVTPVHKQTLVSVLLSPFLTHLTPLTNMSQLTGKMSVIRWGVSKAFPC